jgi:16S rRNA (adenine(1408)-N(1))-methyltransferase
VVIDLGTGDGRAVLRRAQRGGDWLVVGIDPDAASLRDASRRAARAPRKGGLPNALFLVGAADELPGPLAGTADELTVTLPWGSLLRGLSSAEPVLLDRLRRTLAEDGRLELMLSVGERERSLGLPSLDGRSAAELSASYSAAGLDAIDIGPATADDVALSWSSWAKRLGVPHNRPAWMFRLSRRGPGGQQPPGPLRRSYGADITTDSAIVRSSPTLPASVSSK